MRTKYTSNLSKDAWDKVVSASAIVGALRKYSYENRMPLRFENIGFTFVNKDLTVNVPEFLKLVVARSKGIPTSSITALHEAISEIVAKNDPVKISSGKDVISILSIALNKLYKICNAHECSATTLTRMLRIGATQEDIKLMNIYTRLKARSLDPNFIWVGADL